MWTVWAALLTLVAATIALPSDTVTLPQVSGEFLQSDYLSHQDRSNVKSFFLKYWL